MDSDQDSLQKPSKGRNNIRDSENLPNYTRMSLNHVSGSTSIETTNADVMWRLVNLESKGEVEILGGDIISGDRENRSKSRGPSAEV